MKQPETWGSTSIWKLLALTGLTAGIYASAWFVLRKPTIDRISHKEEMGAGSAWALLLLYILLLSGVTALALCFVFGGLRHANTIHLLTSLLEVNALLVGILGLYICFKVRKILLHYADATELENFSISRLKTLVFTIYYLQYKLNTLQRPPLQQSVALSANEATEAARTVQAEPADIQSNSPQDEARSEFVPNSGINDGTPTQALKWAMFCHLSALSPAIGVPFGNLLGPLIVWLFRRNRYAFVDNQGKEALNFQITMTLAAAAAALLSHFLIGGLILLSVALVNAVLVVTAAANIMKGNAYRYPFRLDLIK